MKLFEIEFLTRIVSLKLEIIVKSIFLKFQFKVCLNNSMYNVKEQGQVIYTKSQNRTMSLIMNPYLEHIKYMYIMTPRC